MKSTRYFILTFLSLALLCGCEFEFDVHSKAVPGIYMQCMACPDSSMIYMDLKYAAPAQGNTNDIPELAITRLDVSVGGKAMQAELREDGIYAIRMAEQPSPGSIVKAVVEAEGLPAVEASCAVPSIGARLAELEMQNDTLMMVPLQIFTATMSCQPEEGYFAFLLEKSIETNRDSCATMLVNPMVGAGTDTEVEIAQVGFSMSMLDEDGDDKITVVPANAFRDGKITLTLVNGGEPLFGDWMDGEEEEEDEEEVVKTTYTLTAFAVSESFYRYALAVHRSQRDFMAMMGLAPANFAWSNVKGGFGVCGSIAGCGEVGFSF